MWDFSAGIVLKTDLPDKQENYQTEIKYKLVSNTHA